jgi:hypothetical protein
MIASIQGNPVFPFAHFAYRETEKIVLKNVI